MFAFDVLSTPPNASKRVLRLVYRQMAVGERVSTVPYSTREQEISDQLPKLKNETLDSAFCSFFLLFLIGIDTSMCHLMYRLWVICRIVTYRLLFVVVNYYVCTRITVGDDFLHSYVFVADWFTSCDVI